jgi:hypothetical protein
LFLQSVIWYRSGDVIQNSILFKSDFPVGYVAKSSYATDCFPIGNPTDTPEESLKYCEDIAFWDLLDNAGKAEQRLLLASCDPGRRSWNTVMGPLHDPKPHGALWVHVPPERGSSSAPTKAQRITLKNYPEGHDFHPLGLEIYPSYGGNSSNLYVINHARERSVIEQFLLNPSDPTTATHIRTLTSPYFISPNSLTLTSPDSFYVSNDHLFTRRLPILGLFLPIIESILALPLSFVSHIDLSSPSSNDDTILKHTFASLFLPFPNGISLSPSGTQVALAVTSQNKVLFYERDPATNVLTKRTHAVAVPFCPDNVRWTHGTDELIVTGHPHFPSINAVVANTKGAASASWVVSINPNDAGDKLTGRGEFDLDAPVPASSKVSGWSMTTLFQSDGSEGGLMTSSTALKDPKSGVLYVSGLYDERGVVMCRSVE